MSKRRVFDSIKELWRNLRVAQTMRNEKLRPRAAVTTDELDVAYERLRAATENDEALCKDLDRLKSTADSGLRLSWWSRRFALGFGVAKAIEEWFQAYDKTDSNQPLLDRIPRSETSNVAAKWLWFGFSATLLGVVLSLLVAGTTAYFLIKQTNILALQAENTHETNTNAQRTQYTQILYDLNCEMEALESESKSPPVSPRDAPKAVCTPIYNFRIRSEAAKALVNLEHPLVTDLRRAQLENAPLANVDFHGANLSGANLSGAVLVDADLTNVDLTDSKLNDVQLNGADLNGATFNGATFSDTDFTRMNFSGTDFSNVIFSDAILYQANLAYAKFTGATLSDVNFYGANLTSASLRKANLSKAYLGSANLSGADLSNADLRGADFRNANLSNVNFHGATLSDAYLLGAYVTQSQLDTACGDKRTALPIGLTIKMCPTIR